MIFVVAGDLAVRRATDAAMWQCGQWLIVLDNPADEATFTARLGQGGSA